MGRLMQLVRDCRLFSAVPGLFIEGPPWQAKRAGLQGSLFQNPLKQREPSHTKGCMRAQNAQEAQKSLAAVYSEVCRVADLFVKAFHSRWAGLSFSAA